MGRPPVAPPCIVQYICGARKVNCRAHPLHAAPLLAERRAIAYTIFAIVNIIGEQRTVMNIGSALPKRVLIADDEFSILSALQYYFNSQGYEVLTASSATEALELFRQHSPPVVITDLRMPGMGGDTLLAEIRKIDEYAQVIIITGFATLQSAITTMKSGAFDYITKPFRLEVVGHSVQKAMEHVSLMITNRHLQENSLHVLEAMVKTIEQRDYYTAGHSLRVTAWADAVAEELGLPETERRVIHLAGLIHDVGKIGIDDSILRKPGSLTFEEFEVIKAHPEKGVNIVEPLEFMRDTIPIIRHHHERFDGSGYPERLAGHDIPLGARILTVADTFDAITSSRAYRDARSPEMALDELRRCCGSQFDPELVAAFIRIAPNGTPLSPD